MTDEDYMRMAIALAVKGEGHVNPNPMVGAVIVKDGRVIGQGYHEKYGELHAERNAIASLTESAENATIYVTLEPCCHYGKTPPCTSAIIENGIRRVVIGSGDPNPLVAGKGIRILREHGIEVTEGVLKEECDAVNPVFFHYIRTKTPYVTMKYAQTLDGKIACFTGASKWVTGEEARAYVQHMRNRHMAIMVGAGTVRADDPMLNCRLEGGRNPVRIICDSTLRTSMDSKIVKTAGEIRTVFATVSDDPDRIEAFQRSGCEIIRTTPVNGRVNLKELMQMLGEQKIDSVLLEGGSTLNWSALQAGIVTHISTFLAPKIFGGESAKTAVGGEGVKDPSEAFGLKNQKITQIGQDLLIDADL